MSKPPTPLSDEIFRRYNFRLPDAYWEFLDRGCNEFSRSKSGEVTLGENFVWLFNMEFMSPQEVLDYQFADYQRPGFVPFAHDPAGDRWCWQPEHDARIVLCPNDSVMAEVYAETFEGALFRTALDYASGGFDEEDEARENLRTWANQLSFLWPPEWRDELRKIAGSRLQEGNFGTLQLISDADFEVLVKRELAFDGIGEEFQWTE